MSGWPEDVDTRIDELEQQVRDLEQQVRQLAKLVVQNDPALSFFAAVTPPE